MLHMKRREFITLLGGVAAWPLTARAQPARPVPIVGLVSIAASTTDTANFGGFLEQMRELGYVVPESRQCSTPNYCMPQEVTRSAAVSKYEWKPQDLDREIFSAAERGQERSGEQAK